MAIWWIDDPGRLSPAARSAISDGRNQAHLSVASIWEIGLKMARNKLRLPPGYIDVLQSDGIGLLDIRREHAERAQGLPPHHADPFDRMLIAQAEVENLIVVTRDAVFHSYGIPILDA